MRHRARPAESRRRVLAVSAAAFVCATARCAFAADGEWPMATLDHANTRFSTLAEIDSGNVKNLRPVFTFPMGVDRGQEAAPIVVGGTMYVVAPFPNYVYALDL